MNNDKNLQQKQYEVFEQLMTAYESIIAKIILYSVYEIPFSVTVGNLNKVLRGSKSAFIRNNELSSLTTYQVFNYFPREKLKKFILILKKEGFLEYKSTDYGNPHVILTEKGMKFISSGEPIITNYFKFQGSKKKDIKPKKQDTKYHGDLAYQLKNSPNSSKRAHAAYLMGETQDTAYVSFLCEATNDTSVTVRRLSASALGKIGDPKGKDDLIKLLEDPNPQVRQYAARALRKLGYNEIHPALPKFKPSKEPSKNDQPMGDNEIETSPSKEIDESSKLIHTLLKDPNENERTQAAYKLGNNKDPHTIDALCKASQDNSANVRRLSVIALGKIGDQRAEKTLIELLHDPEPYTRQYAIISLGKISSKNALPHIKKLTNDPVSYVRDAAYKTISNLNTS